jgi:NADH-quinone oxidoreductase subunit L
MVNKELIAALIPFFPLAGFLLIALNSRRMSHAVASIVACGAVLMSFVAALLLFFTISSGAFEVTLFQWITTRTFSVSFTLFVDPLSSLMMLIITGVGFLIHVYSTSYMHDDEGYNRFFSYLNLFVFFMLLLVMGSNYLLMFVGWEGVGLCSYLLIGFWFKNQSYNDAANKAFIMNRIGDLGMILGIILLFVHFGSLNYSEVFSKAAQAASTNTTNVGILTTITLLLFVGAMGKSAQLPLYTWLPDAMAGPTPVSALIHAATMVTAGIYMIARSNILYSLSPVTLDVITYVGLGTAIFAATIAMNQNDIKKVLAYSTVSQLGLMFVALGLGAYSTGVFHMATHAFFKALLFLGAGSVIHALHGEQDIRRMGGLKKYLPYTFVTFLIGVLAISGVPPFAGFFSKDEILAKAFEHSTVLWILVLIASLLTAFYMFRLLFLVFFTTPRADRAAMDHIHESPAPITIPLILLAVLSTLAGFLGMPEIFNAPHWLQNFLAPVFDQPVGIVGHEPLAHSTEWTLMGTVVTASLVIIALAYFRYVAHRHLPVSEHATRSSLSRLIYNKYYVDEIYDHIIVIPLKWVSGVLGKVVERGGIDRFVNGFGTVVSAGSKTVRLAQTGSIGSYVLLMVIGIVALLIFSLIK